MARKCDICNKGTMSGNKVSHSNNRTKKKTLANLHTVRATISKNRTQTMRVCTKCIKAGFVTKRIHGYHSKDKVKIA